MYLLSLFSSSFIEEEHQIWYFLEITQLYLILFTAKKYIQLKDLKFIAFLLIVTRLSRMINQTGNKWIHLKDIGDMLREFESKVPQLLCSGVSLLLVAYVQTLKIKKNTFYKKEIFICNLVLVYLYQMLTCLELFQL